MVERVEIGLTRVRGDEAAVVQRPPSHEARRLARAGRSLALPALLLLCWEAVARFEVLPGHLLPAATTVLDTLWEHAAGGELARHVLATGRRVVLGFALGTAAATALGVVTGFSSRAREALDPLIQALKAVPSLAWVPLFILWFGIFETPKVLLIAVGSFFPVYLNLMEGIQSVDRKLFEVGRVCGLSRRGLVRRILIPGALPTYVVGLRAGLALGWMFVIAAELMGASEGLGFLMIDGQMTGQPALILGSLILFAVAGKLTDALLIAGFRRPLAWQDGFAAAGGDADAPA